MSYESEDTSIEGGQPFFLYQFAQDSTVWRFTSRSTDWIVVDGEDEIVWTASAVSHGDVVQSDDIVRSALEVVFPLSDEFARRFLAPPSSSITTLTIFRGHEAAPDDTVAHWKGRVLGGAVEGRRINLNCESVFSTIRRSGVRAKYQSLCRHVLYRGGCGLNIESHFVTGVVTGISGLVVSVTEAASQPDGWYAAGVLRFGAQYGFILEHAGTSLRLSSPIPELVAAWPDPLSAPVNVQIAPGCDLRDVTCEAKFGNLLNFGGFPDIPGRNPWGGKSVV